MIRLAEAPKGHKLLSLETKLRELEELRASLLPIFLRITAVFKNVDAARVNKKFTTYMQNLR